MMTLRSLVVVLMATTVIGSCGSDRRPPQEKSTPILPKLGVKLPPSSPVGTRAITALTGATPAFTTADVERYVATHPLLPGVSGRVKPTVTKIEFVSSAEASNRLAGETTGFPDDHLLCYVELQGPVTFSGPNGTKVTYPRGVLIFDAQSGNLVILGGMP